MSDAAQEPRRVQPRPSAAKTWYLIQYNGVSAFLWTTVLVYAVVVPPYKGFAFLYPATNDFLRWTQTLAVLEIAHSALGVVRAPLLTTLMQVWSRLLIVWGAVYLFPEVALSPAYTTLLLAWGLTETVRYTYFTLQLGIGAAPRALVWLRYNLFFVLYPIGVGSEVWLLWLVARGPARGTVWEVPAYLVLAPYPIGFPVLFGHMMKQRRKVLQTDAGKKTN